MTGMASPPGRWERLALDLDGQAAAWETAERAGEIAERQRIEAGRMRLIDRLRPSDHPGASGSRLEAAASGVVLTCAGGLRIRGVLVRVVSDAVIVAEDGGRESLVSLPAILSVIGASAAIAESDRDGTLASRIGLRNLLRSVVRDRSIVRVHLVDGSILDGTLDRVGADFVEVALHPAGEARRRDAVRDTAVVALSAVAAIRRDAE